jgi:hypothetical protein
MNQDFFVKKYYPVPPMIRESVYEYQNINKDMNLRYSVTLFFIEKVKKWINKYPEFKSIKINYDLIYKILRKIVKKTGYNWYDLRTNSTELKKYFIKFLS